MLARLHGQAIPPAVAAKMAPPQAKGLDGAPPTFGFMFGTLADDPANRLPEGPATIQALEVLGQAMARHRSSDESVIPAAFTYFGQFIDHDVTLTAFDGLLQPIGGPDPIEAANLGPLTRAEIETRVRNARTGLLDLDSVYGGLAATDATEPDGRMTLGILSVAPFGTISTADRLHDLPRRPMDLDPGKEDVDRQALIGDARNDENLIVAQLHVAFLRSHNALMTERKMSAEEARKAIRRRYQWAVLDDFLRHICDPDVHADVMANGPSIWRVDPGTTPIMPVEFAAAAYRFGHSMVRPAYFHNTTFDPADFNLFFMFTALSGIMAPSPDSPPGQQFKTFPDNWVIDWVRFFPSADATASRNPTRLIDTRLTPALNELTDTLGEPVAGRMGQLPTRNLLRGYLIGLPTGQAVAGRMGVPVLPAQTLRDALPAEARAAIEAAGLLERTPLWFYLLAEAGDLAGPKGQHLGPIGSRIVAETLWTFARHAEDSVIRTPPTPEELATGEFSLKGLIRIGQDKGMTPLP